MGEALCIGFKAAVKDCNNQRTAHEGLTENFPEKLVSEWETMCTKWEREPYPKGKTVNLYVVPEAHISVSKALKELAESNQASLCSGGVSYHKVTTSGFIMMVLEGQDSQRKLAEIVDQQKKDPTVIQSTKVLEQRNTLHRRIRYFQALQAIYMPGLMQFRANARDVDEEEDSIQPETTKLWLSSDIPKEKHEAVSVRGLDKVEAKLQQARCYDALNALRHTLRIKARLMQFKNTNVRGQRESECSRAIINRVYMKARHFASHYRIAHKAYLALVGTGDWEKTLRVLEDGDVRSYKDPALVKKGPGRKGTAENDDEEEISSHMDQGGIELIAPDRNEWAHRTVHGTGETRKQHSWIWTAGGSINVGDGAEGEDNQILCSEWCRSRAQVKRAEEEGAGLSLPKATLEEGMDAYASMQEAIQLRLCDTFHSEWKKPLEDEVKGREDQDEEAEKEGLEGEVEEAGRLGVQDMEGHDDELEEEEDQGED
ncbi:hypothetical protein VNI00_016981 [Paramarasmius palmivorus]|uniref:Uncharacterized protein n=1 Tax=Paramarasmius palmivorus TaxID=297713 RepID=A0AAW0BAQ9_9AGAR